METKTLRQTVTFRASPREVYDMLMDSKKHQSLSGVPAKISKKVGGRFTAWGSHLSGFNLVLKPGENLWQFVPDNCLSNRVSSNSATISSTVATPPGTSSSISSGDCLHWTARLDQWVLINRTCFNINLYNLGHMVPRSNLSQWCVTSVGLHFV